MILQHRIDLLDDYLKDCIDKRVFPGVSYAVVTKDESHINSLGFSQIMPDKLPLEPNPIYDIASLTKVVGTVSGILFLMEDGKVSLSTKIKDIIPEFKHDDITILNLLTHTSGLPSLKKYYEECKDKYELIHQVCNADLVYPTGSKVEYSDLGFMVLGFVIEKTTGSLEKFIKERLFVPLGMKDTGFNPGEEKIKRCAATEKKEGRGIVKGKVHDGNAYFMGGISGHAGLFSTAEDLSHFVKTIIRNGFYEEKNVLNYKSIRLMTHSFTENLNESRGMGWQINRGFSYCDLASENAIYHTGFTGTSILIDKDFGFVLLTNRVHPDRNNMKLIGLRKMINNLASAAVSV